uniref:F-box domain-containing protein n=1 Tax=Angiostrongylus cantonensis TaxID=6313 RepID=A0A0K0CZZ9_ANGCA
MAQEVKTDECNDCQSTWCLGVIPPETPFWPPPIPDIFNDVKQSGISDYIHLALLWRASVVDNGGHVLSIIGETFVPQPLLLSKLRTHAKILYPTCKDAVSANESAENVDFESNCLSIFTRPVKPVKHDFEQNSAHRLCQIPLEVLVTNVDVLERVVNLTFRHMPKVSEAVTSLTQLPPENRQQWWIDRKVVRAVLNSGECRVFRFVVRYLLSCALLFCNKP